MNAIEFGEAQLLWKMFYARECFAQSKAAAQHILEAKLERDHPLFVALITAVYVLYARPFTRSEPVGKLGDEMIPEKQLDLHRLLLEHRHKVYAHKDAVGFPIADYGPANQVRASVRTSRGRIHLQLFATDFHARFPAMPCIIDLCGTLHDKCDYHVDKLWERYGSAVPKKAGEYMLNVHDLPNDMWLLAKPMVPAGDF